MHRDINRNDFVATLAERQIEMAAHPQQVGSDVLSFDDKLYQFISTADGSPSVRKAALDQPAEAMHHSGGALTESLYVYGEALESALELKFEPAVLSVGLGCGYNEWITLGLFLKHQIAKSQMYLESFESDLVIRSQFLQFLDVNGELTLDDPPDERLAAHFQKTFALALKLVADAMSLTPYELLKLGRWLVCEKKWRLRATLDSQTQFDRTFGAIFFDAFSSKSSPTLWSHDFLAGFLAKTTAPFRVPPTSCVFATYASKANLKHALEWAGFELKKQAGFAGKRESTRAYRYGRT